MYDEGERSPVIIFLTDGEATGGVTDDRQILANVVNANEGMFTMFYQSNWFAFKQYSLEENNKHHLFEIFFTTMNKIVLFSFQVLW